MSEAHPVTSPSAARAPSTDRVIPPMVVGPLTEDQEPVLLWVHTGTATVEAAGAVHRLAAGEALWVPPGVTHRTRTDAGAVVFPFFLEPATLPGTLSEVHVVSIPPGWEAWLIHRWDDNSHTRDPLPGSEALLGLIAAAPPRRDGRTGFGALPLPRSREALDVAHALLRHPASPRGVESFAAQQKISAKTLQRQFLHETGMAFSTWRVRSRIATAAGHISEGRTIGWAGRHVGYATPTGFTKAFRNHTGLTPSAYARRHRTPSTGTATGPDEVDEVDEVAEHAVALAAGTAPAAPPIPPRAFWELVNDFHVLMWVYRGEVQLRIGTHRWALTQGQAIWVPAGLTHAVEFAAGALMMSIGRVYGRAALGVDELVVLSFPPEAETFLLHTMAAEYTAFRPETDRGAFVDALFREQFVTGRDRDAAGLTGLVGEIARALRRDPADPRSLADWAARFGASRKELGREFTTQTGETFPRWRAQLKMAVARQLLTFGDTPGAVSRHLGYASPAAFTIAFTAAHGLPPREYRRRETRRPETGDGDTGGTGGTGGTALRPAPPV